MQLRGLNEVSFLFNFVRFVQLNQVGIHSPCNYRLYERRFVLDVLTEVELLNFRGVELALLKRGLLFHVAGEGLQLAVQSI